MTALAQKVGEPDHSPQQQPPQPLPQRVKDPALQDLAQTWLSLQCRMIAGVQQGTLLLESNGSFKPAASWPKGSITTPELSSAIESTIKNKKSTTQDISPLKSASKQHCNLIACPLITNNKLIGVVGIEILKQHEARQQTVMHMLQWGTTWLEIMLTQQGSLSNSLLASATEYLTTCLEYENVQIAATALATELASRLGFERVSVGFLNNKRSSVYALSNSVRFDTKSNLICDISGAMDEALDQKSIIVYPASSEQPFITRTHEKLSRQCNDNIICTIPLMYLGEFFGALTFERDKELPLDEMTLGLCIQVASLVGPVLGLRAKEDKWIPGQIWQKLNKQLSKLFGPNHPFFKLTMSVSAATILLLSFITGEYRITAPAALEGQIQRVIVAPINGFIASTTYRAGDIVSKGTVLTTLDDRELSLEKIKWSSQRKQYKRELHKAMSEHDRAQVSIMSAKVAQVDAQVKLIDEQLSRMLLRAPLDGIIVDGDLSQSLGAPVERGQVLFTVAPLDSYRIILKVDEREISNITKGQQGQLVLSSVPGKALTFKIVKVTPVSDVEEGINSFRVEATLEKNNGLLRPGMSGIGKIETGQQKLIWIWTHKFFEWINLKIWFWWL